MLDRRQVQASATYCQKQATCEVLQLMQHGWTMHCTTSDWQLRSLVFNGCLQYKTHLFVVIYKASPIERLESSLKAEHGLQVQRRATAAVVITLRQPLHHGLPGPGKLLQPHLRSPLPDHYQVATAGD